MKKQKSIDGFVLKRRDDTGGAQIHLDKMNESPYHLHRPVPSDDIPDGKLIEPSAPNEQLLQADVDESLQNLDAETPITRRKRKKARKSDKKKKPGKKRKIVKRIVIILIVLVLAGIGYVGWRLFVNLSKSTDGNPWGIFVSNKRLKADANGRTNILVFGDESDSEVHADAGAELTDSIMVISINQDTYDAALYSIPRDLWVKMPSGCSIGGEAKINAVYMCNMELSSGDERASSDTLRQTVSKYTGQDIQYYAKANFTLVKQAVDAVGGITVDIESDDPRGILDRNFDWECNYECYFVKHPNGPVELDGKHALALARARNAAGGYGLSGGNFDREVYQQKIAIAVKDKAVSAGTISNPVKVTKLLDAFGDNVVMNIQPDEIQSLAKIAQKIDNDNIRKLTFIDKEDPLVTTGMHNGQSIVLPVAGLYDFSDIKAYLARELSSDPVLRESATIGVYNGSDIEGAAAAVAENLRSQDLNAAAIGNAPNVNERYVIYDLSDGNKPATSEKLAKVYGVTVQAIVSTDLPEGVQAGKDFVIIVGSDGAN